MSDIYVVSMPFAPLEWPSLGIGQLVAAAKAHDLDARALYPSLWFAKTISVPTYRLIADIVPAASLLGEWLFSRSAYQDFNGPHEKYLDMMLQSPSDFRTSLFLYYHKSEASFKKEFRDLQKIAGQFAEKTAREIVQRNPKIVGCSTSFQQYSASVALLRHVKHLEPSVTTMLGGANCEAEMGYVTAQKFPWIDFVVSGEADNIFPDFCTHILEKGADLSSENIPGGVYCKTNVSVFENTRNDYHKDRAEIAIVSNMDDVPIPDYSDYFEELEHSGLSRTYKPKLLMESSRGCWKGEKNPCNFCGLNGKRLHYRAKSPERILRELECLHTTYGVRAFIMSDTILNMGYFSNLFKELSKESKPYKFVFETRSMLKEEQVQLLSDAGVVGIQPGIESLHNTLLTLLNKKNSAIHNIALLKYALENGITVTWNLLYHIPGDKDLYYQAMANFLPLLYHLEPPMIIPIRYDRFSPYYEKSPQFGLTLSPLHLYHYVYPFEQEELDNFAYFFEERSHQRSGEPGLMNLIDSIVRWRSLFYSTNKNKSRVQLMFTETNTETNILDTRPCGISTEFALTGIERCIHNACRHPVTRTELDRLLSLDSTTSGNKQLVEHGMQQLIHKKLLLKIEPHYLALANYAPRKELPARYRHQSVTNNQ